jgi:hypothetical protein
MAVPQSTASSGFRQTAAGNVRLYSLVGFAPVFLSLKCSLGGLLPLLESNHAFFSSAFALPLRSAISENTLLGLTSKLTHCYILVIAVWAE